MSHKGVSRRARSVSDAHTALGTNDLFDGPLRGRKWTLGLDAVRADIDPFFLVR